MNIIFTDYEKEEFEYLRDFRFLKCFAGFAFLFISVFSLFWFMCKDEVVGLLVSIIALVIVSSLYKSVDKNDCAKYIYAYSLDKNGKENIKSQEYDQESSQLIITYNKEDEEIKSYINLRNMIIKFDDTMTDPIINFDTNEIIKPRVVIGGPGSGNKRLSGGEEE